ncbi:MAG: 16S rRNA (uracil(1498)-N(3))-methyltransferase [Synoicihabitans sp.]
MNIVLFDETEVQVPLPRTDPRARHIVNVLRREVGDDFDAGLINGPRGKATLEKITDENLELGFSWEPPHPAPTGPRLAIGFPRPQTARDILRDATSLGVAELNFISTARSDPNYPASSLWTSGEWRRHLITGAAQAFDTHVPVVTRQQSLDALLEKWRTTGVHALALDLYDTVGFLGNQLSGHDLADIGILIGPERGWDDADRQILTNYNVDRFDLGPRVQRTEIAVAVSLGIIRADATRA